MIFGAPQPGTTPVPASTLTLAECQEFFALVKAGPGITTHFDAGTYKFVVSSAQQLIQVTTTGEGAARFFVHRIDEALVTTARGRKELATLRDAARAGVARVAEFHADRKGKVKKAVRKAGSIDPEILRSVVDAMTHGRLKVKVSQKIVTAVMQAALEPDAYLAAHPDFCEVTGIDQPIPQLHVIALLHHVPEAHLIEFDWKETMYEVLILLADAIAAGPKVSYDLERWADDIEAWDSKPRKAAMKTIAADLRRASLELIEIDTKSDTYSYALIPARDATRVKMWATKTQLPLKASSRP